MWKSNNILLKWKSRTKVKLVMWQLRSAFSKNDMFTCLILADPFLDGDDKWLSLRYINQLSITSFFACSVEHSLFQSAMLEGWLLPSSDPRLQFQILLVYICSFNGRCFCHPGSHCSVTIWSQCYGIKDACGNRVTFEDCPRPHLAL